MTLNCVMIAAREREVCLDIVKDLSVIVLLSMSLYYIPINDTLFELHVLGGHMIQNAVSNWVQLFNASLA